MFNFFPIKFHDLDKYYLITNDAGDFFFCNKKNMNNLLFKNINNNYQKFLESKGFIYYQENDFFWNNHKYKLLKRKTLPQKINYFMIVPTLRCDLKCSYCQVSRVDKESKGYDWNDEILHSFFNFVEEKGSRKIKVEFQGGEPTLRLDIISKIITWTDKNDFDSEFVICTNLMNISNEFEKILERDNVFISTSIDGTLEVQSKQRTKSKESAGKFFKNFDHIVKKYGIDKISALPTFSDFKEVKNTIDKFQELGLNSIYLRPVNYQGFARKSFPESKVQVSKWLKIYFDALDYIFEKNYSSKKNMTEFVFETNLKRIFIKGHNGHLDLRNPNFAARDNFVIDYDGKLYPSDESRMISRIGIIDLSMGNVLTGPEDNKIAEFNWNQISDTNPDCIHCAYQPYCGIDTVDDLSRYNRIDTPKFETAFCQSHISKFGDIFKRLISNNPKNIYNINGHLTRIPSLDPPYGRIVYD